MLQIRTPMRKEFLGSLRKRADSVTPPPSLSPDAIKKQLPERPKITLTRRLAPFAAAAACLALILTGTYALKSPALPSGSTQTVPASSAEAVAIYDERAYMPFAAQATDYSDIYQMVTENSSKAASSSNKKHTVASSGATDSDALYTLTESGRVEQDGTVLFTPEFPEGGSWKPVSPPFIRRWEPALRLGRRGFRFRNAFLRRSSLRPFRSGCVETPHSFRPNRLCSHDGLFRQYTALCRPLAAGRSRRRIRSGGLVPGTFSDGFYFLLLPDQVEDLGGSTYLTLTALDPNGMILDNVSLYGHFDALILTENGAEWDGGSCPFDRSAFQTEN